MSRAGRTSDADIHKHELEDRGVVPQLYVRTAGRCPARSQSAGTPQVGADSSQGKTPTGGLLNNKALVNSK